MKLRLPTVAWKLLNRLGWDNPFVQRIFVKVQQAGTRVDHDTALTYSAFFCAVRTIAEDIGALEWCVYRRTGKKKEEDPGSNLYWLLNVQANPEMTAMTFRTTLLAHALTWGNGYAEIERDLAGRPAALWPITPDRCEPKRRQDTGALYYQVSFSYGGTVEIEPENMIHIHGLGFDGVMGYSVVTMAARGIGLGIAQEIFSQAFYENGTTFGAMVEVPATLKPTQIAETEKYLNESHGGPYNAFRTKVVPKGSSHSNPGMPLNDAQFLESRQFNLGEMARWFRMPPHKLADLMRSTNNNIEHQSIEYVTGALVPWGVRMEQEINIKLIGKRAIGQTFTKINFDKLMRGDSKTRAEFYRIMTSIGAMTINEVLEDDDRNTIGPEGDERLVQVNQTTLKYLIKNPGGAPKAAPSTGGAQSDGSNEGGPGSEPVPSAQLRRAA